MSGKNKKLDRNNKMDAVSKKQKLSNEGKRSKAGKTRSPLQMSGKNKKKDRNNKMDAVSKKQKLSNEGKRSKAGKTRSPLQMSGKNKKVDRNNKMDAVSKKQKLSNEGKRSKAGQMRMSTHVEDDQYKIQRKKHNDVEATKENAIVIPSDSLEENKASVKGMKKWVQNYFLRRRTLDVLQSELDACILVHEAMLEKERREKEAAAAADGWTVVTHQKGRKKNVDSDTGIAVGSVTQGAVRLKQKTKKNNEVALNFYRFQRREARMNEILELRKKFEEDKKRIAQIRAARKFRPY